VLSEPAGSYCYFTLVLVGMGKLLVIVSFSFLLLFFVLYCPVSSEPAGSYSHFTLVSVGFGKAICSSFN